MPRLPQHNETPNPDYPHEQCYGIVISHAHFRDMYEVNACYSGGHDNTYEVCGDCVLIGYVVATPVDYNNRYGTHKAGTFRAFHGQYDSTRFLGDHRSPLQAALTIALAAENEALGA